MRLDPDLILDLLKPGGRVSAFLKEFESRPEQLTMVRRVVEAFNSGQIALIEAGTGTGKSLAYLLPAVIKAVTHKERTLISTNTINLQEQLVEKDLPLIRDALGLDFKSVLVKGMGNYLCLRKLDDAAPERLTAPKPEADQLRQIELWSQKTEDGSKSQLPFNPYGSVWEKVNCEADTCTYRKCPYYEQCHFFKARKEAEDAQILVSNHHLLFADLAFREEENLKDETAILPSYTHVILDEAHHIEDVATSFFADTVSRTEIMKTMGRLASEKRGEDGGRLPMIKKKLAHFYQKGPADPIKALVSRLDHELPLLRQDVLQALADFFDAVTMFFFDAKGEGDEENKQRLFPGDVENIRWKEEVIPETNKCLHAIENYTRTLLTSCQEIEEIEQPQLQEQIQGLLSEVRAFALRLEAYGKSIHEFVFQPFSDERVRWMEHQQLKTFSNLQLINAKLDISSHLVESLFTKFQTVILCSATLSTGRNFDFTKKRLGLDSDALCERAITELILPSPFDFEKQSLLLVPSGTPPPYHGAYPEKASEMILKAVKASHGNAFILFTSYALMKECAKILAPQLSRLRFPLLKQGDDQRQALLTQFKQTERAVLFGTDSFWEGVDVSGEALRLVVLVKLPFRVPSEPIFQARSELIAKRGGDPFRDYALPGAVVKFKQGFGRLIRHKHDRGVVLVLDNRLMTKGYGKMFLRSLPDCPKQFVQDIEQEMKAFYRRTYPLVADRI